jgi:hypothetical protein
VLRDTLRRIAGVVVLRLANVTNFVRSDDLWIGVDTSDELADVHSQVASERRTDAGAALLHSVSSCKFE